MSVASRIAAWGRGNKNLPGPSRGASPSVAGASLPIVSAGADEFRYATFQFNRTAVDVSDGGSVITSRAWTILSGPADVGSTISTQTLLQWTPIVVGNYTLRYAATNIIGSGTDDISITVAVAPGVAYLDNEFDPGSKLAVQVAWTAVMNTEPGDTDWTDITTDVKLSEGINIRLGMNSESETASPAELQLSVDNEDSSYSLGGHSPNWPNVKKNIPLRVIMDPNGDGVYDTLFYGFISEYAPRWLTSAASIPEVAISASGTFRRLAQYSDRLRSALFTYITTTDPVDYWPMEETKTATEGRSYNGGSFVESNASSGDFEGTGDIDSRGLIKWGENEDYPSTERAPAITDYGRMTLYPRKHLVSTASWSIAFSFKHETFESPAGITFYRDRNDLTSAVVFSVGSPSSTSDYKAVQLSYYFSPLRDILIEFDLGPATAWLNIWYNYVITYEDTGTGIPTWKLYREDVLIGTSAEVTNRTRMPLDMLHVGSVPYIDDGSTPARCSISHVALYSGFLTLYGMHWASVAHRGEGTQDRIERLCLQENIPLTITGTSNEIMGPQFPETLLSLLRDPEEMDNGLLYDGVSYGLMYVCRDARENAPAALTIDASDLMVPFAPTDDDQGVNNRTTITDLYGGTATYEDTIGPLGTESIGVYDGSKTLNLNLALDPLDYASWAVHMGTYEGYRYPSITVRLNGPHRLYSEILDIMPGSRITITNVGTVIDSMPLEDIELEVLGIATNIQQHATFITFQCAPFQSWAIAVVAAESGDDYEFFGRADADIGGFVLGADIPLGGTSLVLERTSTAFGVGELWTTVADDYPMDLSVGGVKIRATACAGTSSPQVMTIDPMPVAKQGDLEIVLWNSPVLSL